MSLPTKFRKLLADVVKRPGWTARVTSKKHIELKHVGGALLYVSGTPGDHRAIRNTIAQVKRAEKLARISGEAQPRGSQPPDEECRAPNG